MSARGGKPERERLIESHLPLVRAIAMRYAGRGETVEDLIQIGAVALIRATDRFDPARGVPFGTFATPAVEGEIRRHLGDRTGSVRIPRKLRRMTSELERSRVELAASLGRPPSVGELATALGVEQEAVDRLLEAEQARGPAMPEDAVDAAAREAQQSTDDRLLLAGGAHVLDDRERRVVLLRFHADMTERQIAREVGISQAQVSRVLARALAKLREELDDETTQKGGGDITEPAVISAARRAAEQPLGTPESTKTGLPGTERTRIADVGALEEQARAAGAAEAPPREDLALPYHVTVKREGSDQQSEWTASLDELPGCEARGATPDQAVENLRSAMETWLSAAVEEPTVISPPRPSSKRKSASSHSGRFLVRMPSTLHEALSRAAAREQVSLNRFVTDHLAASVTSTAGVAAGREQGPTQDSAPVPAARRRRSFRVLLAANLVVIILAASAAVALLVLALERGI